MTKVYQQAFTEALEILSYLNEEDYNKIPKDVIVALEENSDVNYDFFIDTNIPLYEQEFLEETKAILFNIFRDYLATPEQKRKIIKMQNVERQKNELKKQQKYNIDVFANRKKENVETKKNTQLMGIVEHKENKLARIFNYIKKSFNKIKGNFK